jgi:peptide/nickel transport system permease protein
VINYIIRRLLWAVVLFIAVTVVTYIIFFIIPADPARAVAGKNPTPEMILRARHYLGIDKPVYIQYLRFLKRLVIDQDLGR